MSHQHSPGSGRKPHLLRPKPEYLMTTVAARRFGEQLLELRQCRKCNMRIACDPHWQTPGPIKHPRRQFQPALPRSSLPRAVQNRAVQLLNRFMDNNHASSPGMPGIKNLALLPNFGTVGVTRGIVSAASRCPFVLLNDEFPSMYEQSSLIYSREITLFKC